MMKTPGGVREVTLANGCVMECPEVWIEVDTNYVKGKIPAIVLNTPFADLIVSNYIRFDVPTEIRKESELGWCLSDRRDEIISKEKENRKGRDIE